MMRNGQRLRQRALRLGSAIGIAPLLAVAALAGPIHAHAVPAPASVTAIMQSSSMESAADDGTLAMRGPTDPTVYEMPVAKPLGATFRAVDGTPLGQPIYSTVEVVNNGLVLFTIDEASALGSDHSPVDAYLVITNGKLYQHLLVDSATVYPVTFNTIDDQGAYKEVESSTVMPPSDPTGIGTSSTTFISIPRNYRYRPSWGSHHDYCTASPDEFPAPFARNASFRGPCARHDLCYAGTTSAYTCDRNLRNNMESNCSYYYAWYNPLRGQCMFTADIYFIAVVAHTGSSIPDQHHGLE